MPTPLAAPNCSRWGVASWVSGYACPVFPSRRQLALICLVWAVVAWYTVAVWTWKTTDTGWAGAFGTPYAVRAPLVGAVMGLLWSPLFVLGYQPARVLFAAAMGRDPVAEDTTRRHVGRHFRGAILGQLVGASISLALLALWPIELMNSRWDAVKWVAVFWKLYWYLFVPAGALAGAASVAMAARHRLRPAGLQAPLPEWDPAPDPTDGEPWGAVDLLHPSLDLDRVEQASAATGLALLADREVAGGPAVFRTGAGLVVRVFRRPAPAPPGGTRLVVVLEGAPPSAVAVDAALARVLTAVGAGAGATTVQIADASPLALALFRASVAATLPPYLPADCFVRLVDRGDEAGAAALSTGLDRYGLPEVLALAATPEAARAAAWTLVRRVLASGGAIAEAPGVTEVTHPDGGARRLLRYSSGPR